MRIDNNVKEVSLAYMFWQIQQKQLKLVWTVLLQGMSTEMLEAELDRRRNG